MAVLDSLVFICLVRAGQSMILVVESVRFKKKTWKLKTTMKILVPYFLRLLNYSTVFNARNWSWKKKCVFLQNNLSLPTLHVIVPLIVPCIDPITWIFGVIDPTWFTIWSVYKCFIVSSYDNNLIRVVWNLGRWKTAVDQSFYCKVY